MLSHSTMEGPTIPPTARHDRRLRPAVVASLLLHAGLALALARSSFTLSPASDDEVETPAVRVTIVTSSPQSRPAAPLPAPPEEPVAEIVESPAAPAPAEDSGPDPIEAVTEAAPPADADAANAEEVVLDVNRLREAIGASMITYRREVLEQGLQDCQQYRERYDRWDCPQEAEVTTAMQEQIDENLDVTFRAYTYGHDRNARISEELLADMDAMRPLMEADGVLGTLARQRYYMKALQYENLNPGAVPGIPGGGSIGGPNLGGTVTLMTFSGGGIDVLNGLLTLGPGGIKVKPPQPARAFDEDEECVLPPSRQGQRAGGCW
jgi:hypothetical protein